MRCDCPYIQSLGSQVHLESKFATYIQNEVRNIHFVCRHTLMHAHTHMHTHTLILTHTHTHSHTIHSSLNQDILLLLISNFCRQASLVTTEIILALPFD